jgi:hypothetical protein
MATNTRISDAPSLDERRSPVYAQEQEQESARTAKVVAGGSMAEAIGGAGAVVLSIIALAGLFPNLLATITAIVLGAALLLQGMTLAAKYYPIVREAASTTTGEIEVGGGAGVEIIGGAGGAALGILALLGVDPMILLSVAAIGFGGALLLSSTTNARLNHLTIERSLSQRRKMARVVLSDVVMGTTTLQVLAGLGAIVLGIIGLLSPFSMTLSLVAFLALGAAVLLSAGSLSSKLLTMVTG